MAGQGHACVSVVEFSRTSEEILRLRLTVDRTTLKHIPKSTTDLQLLSAEIRSYMSSGDSGWYHTIGVLIVVGCWKHAWSVPGAVVLVSQSSADHIATRILMGIEHPGRISPRADGSFRTFDIHHCDRIPFVVLALSTTRTAHRRPFPKTTSFGEGSPRTRVDPKPTRIVLDPGSELGRTYNPYPNL